MSLFSHRVGRPRLPTQARVELGDTAAPGVGKAAEGRIGYVGRGEARQARMIQGVEGVEPNLQLHFLRDFEILS